MLIDKYFQYSIILLANHDIDDQCIILAINIISCEKIS